MILFFNVLVTDSRASASGMNRVDRLDLFKYALASYSCIDRVSKVIIYCELAGSYKNREEELKEYIRSIFAGKEVEYHSYSPSNQREWRDMLGGSVLLTTKEPILYMGNDDHIFIDYDLDVLNEGLDLMAKEPEDQITTIHISSFTEGISTIYGLNDFRQVGRYWETELLYSDACQIVNAAFFRHVFFDLDMGGEYMRRTDNFLTNWYPTLGDFKFHSSKPHPKVKMFMPLRELVRHFDAYWHIEVPLDEVPLLEIPKGFFENDIQIPDGVLPEDIPLFWRDRVKTYPEISDREGLVAARNEKHYRAITAPHNRVYQRPGVRQPARAENNYRDLGNGRLPLEQKWIEIGYRQ